MRAVAEHDGKRQGGSGGGGGRYGMDYFAHAARDAAAHGREAARVAIAMLDARDAPAGEMPVVLGAGDCGILLHEAVGHGLEADFNRKQTSNYSGQIGKLVASTLCTVVDDGTIASSRGAINVDDEGYAGQNNVLIENGVLVGYMHDRLSAKHFGVQPTGNGRRESFRSMPLPRMTNTSLLGGQDDPEEIVKSVKRGIFAKRFGGGQVNISNGDFVFSLTESYLIEDGKLTAPLKGVNLIGNGPDVLRRVDMLGIGLRAVRRHLDLRQGRPVRAGQRRHPDGPDRRRSRSEAPRHDRRANTPPAPRRRPKRTVKELCDIAAARGRAREAGRRRRRRGAGARRQRADREGPARRARARAGGRQPRRSGCACCAAAGAR